jgi:hypothetical protein
MKEQEHAVVKQIHECRERAVTDAAHAIASVLRQVQGEGPLRAKKPDKGHLQSTDALG